MKRIEEITRIKKDQRLAVFFMLVLIMGMGILMLGPEDSKFNASCARCYFCVDRCPAEAINLDGHGYPIINKSKCLAWNEKKNEFMWDKCGLCLRGCPTKVIALVNDPEEREIKTVN